MSEYKRIDGCEYIGEVPRVFVQAPIVVISATRGRCSACKSIIDAVDIRTAICGACCAKEINQSS